MEAELEAKIAQVETLVMDLERSSLELENATANLRKRDMELQRVTKAHVEKITELDKTNLEVVANAKRSETIFSKLKEVAAGLAKITGKVLTNEEPLQTGMKIQETKEKIMILLHEISTECAETT